jgi:hypothetical protein
VNGGASGGFGGSQVAPPVICGELSGAGEAVLPVNSGEQGGHGKNEAIHLNCVGYGLVFKECEAEEEFGFFARGGFVGLQFGGGGEAFGLEFGETLLVAGDHAVDAGLVERDVGEGANVVFPGGGSGGCELEVGGFGGDVPDVFEMADAVDVVFGGAGTIETPLVLNDGDGDLGS